MRISDWSSDVCSSDLGQPFGLGHAVAALQAVTGGQAIGLRDAPFGHGLARTVASLGPPFLGAAEIVRRVVQQAFAHIVLAVPALPAQAVIGQAAIILPVLDRTSPRPNSSHYCASRMPSF